MLYQLPLLLFFLFLKVSAQILPHPSVTSTLEQLNLMKEKVINDSSSVPYAGWVQMTGRPESSLNYTHSPFQIVDFVPSGASNSETAMRNDGHAARAHALQWVITGSTAHRDKAIQILNDWVNTFQSWVSSSASQPQLECAWNLPVWLSAADILRYYDTSDSAWETSDVEAFNNFAKAMYEEAYKAKDRNNNWGVSAHLATLAYAAYTDDRVLFESSLALAVSKLGALSQPDGEIEETCRDTWHPQYSIVSWLDAAELANNLGYPDLYEATFNGQTTPRLAIILEYFANMFLGNTPHPCGDNWGYDYVGEYSRFDNYEVGYNHYLYRNQSGDLPVFKEMVENHWRSNVGRDAHFLLWSRLTHGENKNSTSPIILNKYRGFLNNKNHFTPTLLLGRSNWTHNPYLQRTTTKTYSLLGIQTVVPTAGMYILKTVK